MFENFSLRSIQQSILNDYIDALEQQLWSEYTNMDLFQKKICLVSARWWKNFKEYIANKYKHLFDID